MTATTEHPRSDQAEIPLRRRDEAGHRDPQPAPSRSRRATLRKWLLPAALAIGGGAILIVAVAFLMRDWGKPGQPLIYYTVKRGNLSIVVTERGNLESQNNVKVYCEVDDVEGDGIHGTTVLWIIPNGSSVEEGDLLVELDSSNHRERLDRQILDTDQARAEQIKAKAKYENQKTQNKTLQAEAELKIELAQLELEMFEDAEKGTHRLEVEEIKRLIEDVNNEILAAQASLELKKNDKLGIETLFKLGYAGKSELDRSRLEFLQAESAYAAKINKLTTQLATLDKKEDYERRMQSMKFQGSLDTAKRTLTQVKRDNEALLEQAKAATEAADEALKKEQELLARYKEQLDKCNIYAPQSGMVAYAGSQSRWQGPVRQGSPVQMRQHIISLPNLERMQVKTAVHESVLDEVKPGLPVTVRIDTFSQRSYRGSVLSVAVLPDQGGYFSPDIKVYQTIVTIDEDVGNLKPGMTAVVEIHVARIKDVLSVPVQAVTQIKDQNWCYVDAGGSAERRTVQLGRTNGKFVVIREGLDEGDHVVLNPMAILDEESEADSSISPEEDPQDPSEDDLRQPAPSQDGDESLRQGGKSGESQRPATTQKGTGSDRQRGRGPNRRGAGSR